MIKAYIYSGNWFVNPFLFSPSVSWVNVCLSVYTQCYKCAAQNVLYLYICREWISFTTSTANVNWFTFRLRGWRLSWAGFHVVKKRQRKNLPALRHISQIYLILDSYVFISCASFFNLISLCSHTVYAFYIDLLSQVFIFVFFFCRSNRHAKQSHHVCARPSARLCPFG